MSLRRGIALFSRGACARSPAILKPSRWLSISNPLISRRTYSTEKDDEISQLHEEEFDEEIEQEPRGPNAPSQEKKFWVDLYHTPMECIQKDVRHFALQHGRVQPKFLRRHYDTALMTKLPVWRLAYPSEDVAREQARLLHGKPFGFHFTKSVYRGIRPPKTSSFHAKHAVIVRNIPMDSSVSSLMHSMGNLQWKHHTYFQKPGAMENLKATQLNTRYRFSRVSDNTKFVVAYFRNEMERSYCAVTVPDNVFDKHPLQLDILD